MLKKIDLRDKRSSDQNFFQVIFYCPKVIRKIVCGLLSGSVLLQRLLTISETKNPAPALLTFPRAREIERSTQVTSSQRDLGEQTRK